MVQREVERERKFSAPAGFDPDLTGLIEVVSTATYELDAQYHDTLSCTLADNVCTMGGLRPASGGGYTIVEGDGLPYIHIIGHETRVDWSTLVSRLKAATTGHLCHQTFSASSASRASTHAR